MNKSFFLCVLLAGVITGCSSSNLQPSSTYIQQLNNVSMTVTRVDLNAIHVKIKNDKPNPVMVEWNKSTINDKSLVKDYVEDFRIAEKNTILKTGESIDAVLYIKDSISYRNPVLYQPGGYIVNKISYPATLSIVVDNVKNIKTVNFK